MMEHNTVTASEKDMQPQAQLLPPPSRPITYEKQPIVLQAFT